jgi:hypothetical protein
MRLRSLPGRTVLMIAWCIAWSEVAEDRRFELLRGCPQHAFQVCAAVSVMVNRVRELGRLFGVVYAERARA